MPALYVTLTLQTTDQVLLRYWGDRSGKAMEQYLSRAAIDNLLQSADSDLIDLPVNLKRIGKQLFDWLQGTEHWLTQALRTCAEPDLVLALAVDPSLAHLPWEALHDGTQFLNERTNPVVAVVRWLDAPVSLKPPAPRSLQVLFMATSPDNVQPVLDFEAEEANILRVTQDLPLNLRVEESGCLAQLGKLWSRYPKGTFDVFHLTGHAAVQSQAPHSPYFITETVTGERHDATAVDLAAPFKLRRPRLVFLSGCRTGQSSPAVPSLAQALVQQGLPAILGWGRPVADPVATAAAAYLYARLAEGCELAQAVALTQGYLRQEIKVSDWHRLRLYVRGAAWHALVDPPGDVQPLRTPVQSQFLDLENRVRVATPEEFVGRRRPIQRSLQALRKLDNLGVMLHGLGGVGKSSTAARLLERLPDYDPIVIHRELDVARLERELERQSTSELGLSILQGNLPPMQRLTRFLAQGLNYPNQKFMVVLDDFEANLEERTDGSWVLQSEVVLVLADLMEAIARCGKTHRILITSRYDVPLPEQNHRLHRESLPALRGADLQKKCERLDAFNLQSQIDEELRQQALTLSDGNPRLLEWLDRILQDQQTDAALILERMDQRAIQFRESILAEELLNQQDETLRTMLARGLVFELPVPLPAMTATWTAIPHWQQQHDRAVALGLLEWVSASPEPLCRVPRLLAPLLPPVEDDTLPATATEALYQQWWGAGKAITKEQARELYRLAKLAQNWVVLDEVGRALAGRWRQQGRYREAGLLYEELVEIGKQRWGEEHPEVAISLNNLASLYESQGRYAEAEPLFLQAMQLRQRLLGPDHLQVAISLNNLAGLYHSQGRYGEAEPLYQQALQLWQCLLGPDHPQVATSLNNLASLYKSQGRYGEAEPLLLQAMQLRQRLLGSDHPQVATSLNNLAELYHSQGQYAEAEPLYLQALQLRQHLLGPDHPQVATSLNNLASLYHSQGRYGEAEPLLLQALQLLQHLLGPDYPGVAQSFNNLALLHQSQGQYAEAEPLYLQALTIALSTLGEDHPNTQKFWRNFVGFLQTVIENGQVATLSDHPLVQDLLRQMQSKEVEQQNFLPPNTQS
ncbi:tetratricopeptide repeat protein [Leptolyngbya sp. GB1-A1]|uniref:tetratricopeptide repeat protein n=1 Tax=Leptolyngbya sp. GB1-A1 TaxID=2933908 RepID=UPI003297F491